jgi:hypothetical protein
MPKWTFFSGHDDVIVAAKMSIEKSKKNFAGQAVNVGGFDRNPLPPVGIFTGLRSVVCTDGPARRCGTCTAALHGSA